MRTEAELLIDVLARLNRTGIDYMLTGSMASNYWGIPRTTHDLDFVLVLHAHQVDPLISAFETGFFVQPDSVRGALHPPFQFNILDERSALKADFWILRDSEFECSAFARRHKVELFGSAAWIATAEDIILHKLYWNQITPSERQLSDAAGVIAVQAEKLDVAYLRLWAPKLGIEPMLDDLLSGKVKPKAS
jgi:hypothetical protein